MTDEEFKQAGEFVTSWEKHWTLEGRMNGPLDKRAKEDLIERVAGLLSRKADVKQAKKAKTEKAE